MSDPATASNVGRPAGSGNALPSAEQNRDRLVWVEEEPILPETLCLKRRNLASNERSNFVINDRKAVTISHPRHY